MTRLWIQYYTDIITNNLQYYNVNTLHTGSFGWAKDVITEDWWIAMWLFSGFGEVGR